MLKIATSHQSMATWQRDKSHEWIEILNIIKVETTRPVYGVDLTFTIHDIHHV